MIRSPVYTDRRTARIIAMQALCSFDAQQDDPVDSVNALVRSERASGDGAAYARSLAEQFAANRVHVDSLIRGSVRERSLERVDTVNRNVLRVATCELLALEVPMRVVFDEAIEIARAYGSAESPAFVNGAIEGVWQSIQEGK